MLASKAKYRAPLRMPGVSELLYEMTSNWKKGVAFVASTEMVISTVSTWSTQ